MNEWMNECMYVCMYVMGIVRKKDVFKWPAFYTSSLTVIGTSASEVANQGPHRYFSHNEPSKLWFARTEGNSRLS